MTESGSTVKIVVVGGVAGGMSAAARARRLDEQAEIIVLERGEHVSFANCGLPYYVSGEIQDQDKLLVQTPESLKTALNLDVRIRHEVTALDTAAQTVTANTPDGTQTITYDALVLAPGATALRPPLPGLDSERVMTLRTVEDALQMRDSVDKGVRQAVVLGGGFIGLEAAEALTMQGLDVTVVELADHVLPPLEAEVAHPVTRELRRLGVTVRTGVAAESVESGEQQDTVVLADGTRLPAELIVLSVGVRPDTSTYQEAGIDCQRGAILVDQHGRTSAPNVWAVGDAVLSTDAVTGLKRPVALAGPANRAGRLVADHILRPATARPIPTAVGTAVVRVGELTAATTGANRAALEAAGITYRTMHLHPNNHAGYFPGATPVHLVIHFHHDDGRLLGAQATGQDGVDKRIDVLATAIRAGMSVEELIDLDLAYAPPYGSAKDPLNFAGMLGSNVLDGTVPLWYAQDVEQWLDQGLVLDVRQESELEVERIPGALNIPHTQLRERLDEVRAAAGHKPVRVLCRSGVRSAIAHRVLAQAGFDSASLSGGMLTLLDTLGDRAPELLEMN
nr:FAD-dependent oxidoreductase [Kocuria subflava]